MRAFAIILFVSAVLRAALILYGDWQDRNLEVPYTDIDYVVFTDAARYVSQNESPFKRATYRYTPLLAYILLPNITWHPVWGKILFSIADLLVGCVIYGVSNSSGFGAKSSLKNASYWLFNPFTFTISTRGSSDAIVAFSLLATLLALKFEWNSVAGLLWGFSVHFRIFPIIYGPSIVLALAFKNARKMGGLHGSWMQKSTRFITSCISWNCINFTLTSTATFLSLGYFFFKKYGQEFLQHAYLHHIGRRDPRHNFSIYFYSIYLSDYGNMENIPHKIDAANWAFGPPAFLMAIVAWRLGDNLPFCWMITTIIFVSFNKVCTAQYFVWYFCLLPIVLPQIQQRKGKGLVTVGVIWIILQINWLWWAYLLEFKGVSTFFMIWISSCLFLMANALLIVQLLRSYAADKPFLEMCKDNGTEKQKGV